MDLSSLQAVMRRVADIEYKIGIRKKPGGGASFQTLLADEMNPVKRKFAENSAKTKPLSFSDPKVGMPSASASGIDGGYHAAIEAAAKKYNVDPALLSAVAEVESGFHQDAVSDAGAVGIMQLMPDTASSLGVNPYNAGQNIEGGARYLSQLLQSFGGDVKKAVAAYNAGPEAVRAHGGVPPYGETQNYVDSVLDLYR